MPKTPLPLLAAALLAAPLTGSAESVARAWNEENLAAIRLSFPDPPVHARNLFHTSVAMWDAWAAYDPSAVGYLHRETATVPPGHDLASARREAISYAAYRILVYRYVTRKHPNTTVANSLAALDRFNARMAALEYDPAVTTDDPADGSPAAVGNRVARTILDFVKNDGSNEAGGYTDPTYEPVNDPLILIRDGTTMNDPNRWQPLEFVEAVSQTGQPLDFTIQEFLGPHWGEVWPFALSRQPGQVVHHDPGTPPLLGGAGDGEFKAGVAEVIRYSSRLDPATAPVIDCSPGTTGNNSLGRNDGTGHQANPLTGSPYPDNEMNEADYGRVIAEFWADGPDSETPPGHWNTIANQVVDHPAFVRRFTGNGPELDPLEWDVKMYFALNGAVHDAAVAAWGCKRHYDYVRPISAIRYQGVKGQSSDPDQTITFDPEGLPLIPGLIETVTVQSVQPGGKHRHLGLGSIGKTALYCWAGEPNNPETEIGGVEWIRADRWFPYQRATFVTPAFAGYISGHSTFSRAAAEVLARMTGSAFFPGGIATHDVPAGSLEFEAGPSAPVQLQWATYYDAADQAGISRLYGGIHVPADDGPGRVVGSKCGIAAWNLGLKYFDGSILREPPRLTVTPLPDHRFRLDWPQYRGLFYRVRRGPDLQGFEELLPFARATGDRASLTVTPADSAPQEFYQVTRAANP
ncbi:MAG: vanadium-dependent haloperoxidase, partial [Akkermansiaceae bacterium]|nr:vanadium-dependent haloperoxidase [Akkermansiaceae bacterium]NIV25562.1 hypothetical protein [Gemmatimonadota bacterium]NIW77646.1 hypothetical protein [Gemmatimonadota bacterium]